MARLRIEFSGASTLVGLGAGETTVGRSNRCTVHLPDPRLGEIHFRISRKGAGYRLKDDGSGSGTRVNGRPVFATGLSHGDVIEAGALRCVFLEREDAAPRVRPAPPPPPVPAAAPPRAAPVHRAGDPRRRLWMAGGLLGVALLIAAVLLLRKDTEKEASAAWTEALVALKEAREAEGDARPALERARESLEKIVTAYAGTRTAGTAMSALAETRRALEDLSTVDREASAPAAGITEAEAQQRFARLGRLREGTHPAVARRAAEVEEDLKRQLVADKERLFSEREEQARTLLADRKFADAVRLWRQFETTDFFYRRRADDARAEIEKGIAAEYRQILRRAGEGDDLAARIAFLEANRPVFAGTRQSEDLEVRISALKARKSQREVVVLDTPKTPETTPGEPKTPEPTPAEAGPYADPPAVADLVRGRRYAEAAATLRGISRHPLALVRIEELTLLANLFADLVGAVRAEPARFTEVLLPGGGRGEAVRADEKELTVVRDGAEQGVPWTSIPPKSFVRLFRLAGFEKPPRLAVPIFFDEEDQPKEAEDGYLSFFRSEQAPTTLSRILARRRGVPEPPGGFVLFRNRLLAPAERDSILLVEQIDKLAKESRTGSEKRRLEAWSELAKLGEPATEALALSIRDRRTAAAEELRSNKAFSGARWAAKYGAELTQRREDALQFILDPVQYPYPNKTEDSQKEAERLVDRVRELYERPYPLLLQGSEDAKALDQEIRDLDERLARIDPLAEPQYDTAVEAVTRRLDMRTVAIDGRDQKRIEYNLAIEKFNRDLQGTSVDAEERANVTAVNEYRWMMGLECVKIDERLVRAARKHSIEMKQLGYFEHSSPTPALQSPGHRARREGYGGGVSENIAMGASSGEQAFVQWFKSSGHHRNMLLNHTEMGCGSASHHWWTQNFGSLTGKSLNPPAIPPDPDPPGQSGNGRPAPE